MTWTAGHDPARSFGSVPALVPPVIPPSLVRKQGVGGTLFTIGVVIALLLGAGVLALVMLATGQPQAIAVGLLFALLPVGPLVACFLWLDRYEPEPLRLLLMAFGWGALVATAAALLLQAAGQLANGSEAWSAVVTAPVTEEAGKGIFVLLLLWSRRHVIDGVLDGLVYAGLVGVGFAFTENILYFAGAYTGGPGFGQGGIGSATALFVLRGVFSPFAHPLFTAAIGIGIGIMVAARNPAVRIVAPLLGYVVAVGLHAAWNGSAFLYDGQFFLLTYLFAMVPGFLLVVGLAIWFRVRERALLGRALSDLAHRGYLQHQEVPWLVELPARRTARRNAALRGGPAAEGLMRDYQQQAIEFAALHHRVMKGMAPDDFAHRGAHMAQRLLALRAHLMLPQHAAPSMPRHAQP